MAAETGKPGTNWKQVTPEHRKKIGPIVRHYMKDPHPFTACVRDNTKRFGPERAKRVCAVVKDMGERSTKWRKGRAREAAEDLEGLFDSVWAPVLEAEGVTVEELSAWSEVVEAAGVLEGVEVEPDDLVREAAAAAQPSHTKRRAGESLGDWGKRLQAGDKANAAAASSKTRAGKPKGQSNADFEGKHKRGRGGKWIVMEGDTGPAAQGAAAKLGVSKLTGAAIRKFQKANGLQIDGRIGQQTAAALLGRRDAAKVKVGNMTQDQRDKLKRLKAGQRSRQAAETGLESVRFRPSDLASL
jgi:hypothetical protein